MPRRRQRRRKPPNWSGWRKLSGEAILAALKQHNYNRTETAKALGISRRSLIYKLQRFRQLGFVIE